MTRHVSPYLYLVTEYQLVVNRGVARRHGWTIPEVVLLRADEVIE